MCISKDSIESGTRSITERIIRDSSYMITGFELNGRKDVVPSISQIKPSDLIIGILLVDEAGKYYSIRPGIPGFRFSKGEITYKEYTRLQERENVLSFSFFSVAVGLLFSVGILLQKFLL